MHGIHIEEDDRGVPRPGTETLYRARANPPNLPRLAPAKGVAFFSPKNLLPTRCATTTGFSLFIHQPSSPRRRRKPT